MKPSSLWKPFAMVVLLCLFLIPVAKAAVAEELSLTDCLRLTEANNHWIQSYRWDYEAKKALASGATGLYGPKIEAIANYQWQSQPTAIIPAHATNIPPVYDIHQRQWGFNLKQNIFDAGKTVALVHFAKENANWQQLELKNQTTTTLNTACMPRKCSKMVCPPTNRIPPTQKVMGRRTECFTDGEKWLASAATSRPKKLTGPTTAVAVAAAAARRPTRSC